MLIVYEATFIMLFGIRSIGGNMEAYCMKCKAKREMQAAEQITMKNGATLSGPKSLRRGVAF